MDVALHVGMSPGGASSDYAHIFIVAVTFALSQDEINTILRYRELDSYLFTLGEAQKALTGIS